MKRYSLMLALAALIAGAFAASIANSPSGERSVLRVADAQISTGKSDRLDGTATETAFLPERFGVDGSRQ